MKRFCTRATGPPQHGQAIVPAVGSGPGGVDRDIMNGATADALQVDCRAGLGTERPAPP